MRKSLAEFRGEKFFRKLLHKSVYSLDGQLFGKISKLILRKRDKKPEIIYVKTPDNRIIKISPESLFIKDGHIYISKFFFEDEIASLAREIIENAKRLRWIRLRDIELDSKYIRGEISEEKYLAEKKALEERRKRLVGVLLELFAKAVGIYEIKPVGDFGLLYEIVRSETGVTISLDNFLTVISGK